jgi:hypothetical protein
MTSARICLCFSLHRFAAIEQEKTHDLLQQKLESMKYLAANSSQFGDVKCEWMWSLLRFGIGLDLNLCELYTGSCRQQRVYCDKQISSLTDRTWTAPGFLQQESSSIVTRSAGLISGYTPSSACMVGRRC